MLKLFNTAPRFGAAQPSDPKPRYNFRNTRNAMLLAMSMVGVPAATGGLAYHTTMMMNDLFSRVSQPQQAPAKVDAKALERQTRQKSKIAIGVFAETLFLAWTGSYLLSFPATKGIRPEQLWKDFMKKGYTGKGLTLGFIDEGYYPTRHMPKEHVTFFRDDNRKHSEKPYLGRFTLNEHGNSVAHIIAPALRDARFVMLQAFQPDIFQAIGSQEQRLLKDLKRNPHQYDIQDFCHLYQPAFNHFAEGVRKCIHEGASSVCVCTAPDVFKGIINLYTRGKSEWDKLLADDIRQNSETPERLAELKHSAAYLNALKDFFRHFNEAENSREVQALLKPWIEALDEAYCHNIPVFVSAGNGTKGTLGLIPHPALIVVNATRENGELADFASEHQNPELFVMGASGDGELESLPVNVSKAKRVLFRLLGNFFRENAVGSSYATPDLQLLYTEMLQAKPNLTIEEAKTIWKSMARPVRLSSEQEKYARDNLMKEAAADKAEITEAMIQEKLKEGLDAMARYGTVAGVRHAIVAETERRYQEELEKSNRI